MNPVYILTLSFLRPVSTLSSKLRLFLQSYIFLWGFPAKIVCISPLSVRATCLAHFTLLDFITLILFSEGYHRSI